MWPSSEEEAFYHSLNLTDEEKEIVKRINAKIDKARTEFAFFMREHQANPNRAVNHQFGCALKGETLSRFMWLRKFVIEVGWETSSAIIADIIESGINKVYAEKIAGTVGSALKMKAVDQLPPEIAQKTLIENFRKCIEIQKRIEQKEIDETLI